MNEALRAMYELLKRDPRFRFEAYQFVREALEYARDHSVFDTAASPSSDAGVDIAASPSRHITGQQLCEACRLYGLHQYGFLAPTVLASWGVYSTSDFGEVVYNLIEIEQMRKSDSDRREDFNDVYEFDTAFVPQFARQTSHPHG